MIWQHQLLRPLRRCIGEFSHPDERPPRVLAESCGAGRRAADKSVVCYYLYPPGPMLELVPLVLVRGQIV